MRSALPIDIRLRGEPIAGASSDQEDLFLTSERKLIFYTTAGCHLCEQAEQLLAALVSNEAVAYDTIDIASDEKLVDLYGIRIPVVRSPAKQAEVGWPFGYEDLLSLI